MEEFDIKSILDKLFTNNKVFNSEADFQLELAMYIKNKYKDKCKIVLEYCPGYMKDKNVYIDILVIINNHKYPIELKYKTKEAIEEYDGIKYYLKEHGAKNINCYLYWNDVKRIEDFKKNDKSFKKGYTIFLTNDEIYLKAPRSNASYKEFSIHPSDDKKCKDLKWQKKSKLKTIHLDGVYYTQSDKNWFTIKSNTKTQFYYLINEIK